MTDAGTDSIEAQLVLWRVFGLNDTFSDLATPIWTADEERGPKAGDRMRISLGDLPEDLVEGLKQWRAQASGILGAIFGGAVKDNDDRLALFDRDLVSITLTEFEEPYPTWFCVCLSRPVPVTAIRGSKLSWLAEPAGIQSAISEFEADGNRYLDGAMARMIGALGSTNLGTMRYGDRRAMLLAEEHAALAVPRLEMDIKDAGVSIGRPAGYFESLTTSIEQTLVALPTGGRVGDLTHSASRWFGTARAEDDDLRRFVFAFAGLETLIGATEKTSRQKLLTRLAVADVTLPASELLWPSTNEDLVNRNLVFRFAVTASVYSPTTAIDDVGRFRDLAARRNSMFHGSDNRIDKAVSIECTELLHRYLGLVAANTP